MFGAFDGRLPSSQVRNGDSGHLTMPVLSPIFHARARHTTPHRHAHTPRGLAPRPGVPPRSQCFTYYPVPEEACRADRTLASGTLSHRPRGSATVVQPGALNANGGVFRSYKRQGSRDPRSSPGGSHPGPGVAPGSRCFAARARMCPRMRGPRQPSNPLARRLRWSEAWEQCLGVPVAVAVASCRSQALEGYRPPCAGAHAAAHAITVVSRHHQPRERCT